MLSKLKALTAPEASTEKPVIVIVPIDKSPLPVISVASVIAPVLVIPPSLLFILLETTSPSASTEKPVIVIVPIVKSPVPSIFPPALISPAMPAPPATTSAPSVVSLDAVVALALNTSLKVPVVPDTAPEKVPAAPLMSPVDVIAPDTSSSTVGSFPTPTFPSK